MIFTQLIKIYFEFYGILWNGTELIGIGTLHGVVWYGVVWGGVV
jgi:hypothetical protein